MFSSIKMEEYMEAERSGIYLLGSPGTQFLSMRVNEIVKYKHLQGHILIVQRFTAFN